MANYNEDMIMDALSDVEDEINREAGAGYGEELEAEVMNILVISEDNEAKVELSVTEQNTLGQVLETCRKDLGIKEQAANIRFTNSANQTTADLNMTIGEFGVKDHSKLYVTSDGKVAADFDDALSDAEDEIRRETGGAYDEELGAEVMNIVVISEDNEAKVELSVTEQNTLGQVLETCRKDLGIKEQAANIRFTNSANQTTADLNMTIGEFGVKDHSKLYVTSDGKVA